MDDNSFVRRCCRQLENRKIPGNPAKRFRLTTRTSFVDSSGSWSRRSRTHRRRRAPSTRGRRRSSGQRRSCPACTARARPEGRAGEHRGDPARSAGVGLDGEGLRHAHGGPEVRPRKGRAAAEPVSDEPVEDRRWSLRAPARRARRSLQPSKLRCSGGGAFAARHRRHRAVGCGQGHAHQGTARARVRARDCGLRDHARATAGRGRRTRYWFLSDDEYTERVDAGEFLDGCVVPAVATARCARRSSESATMTGSACSSSSSKVP